MSNFPLTYDIQINCRTTLQFYLLYYMCQNMCITLWVRCSEECIWTQWGAYRRRLLCWAKVYIYICYVFMNATCHASLIPLDLITLTILSKYSSYTLISLNIEFSPILWRFVYFDTVSNDSSSSLCMAVKIVQWWKYFKPIKRNV